MDCNINHMHIETERLIVRQSKIDDYNVIKNGLEAQLPQQSKFDDEEVNLSSKFTEAFYTESIHRMYHRAKNDESYMLRAFDKSTSEYLGAVILKTLIRKNMQIAEVGYWVLNHHWSNGYGKELVEAALRLGFEHLEFHRIEAYISLDNIASIRIAERAGMMRECIREKYLFEDSEWQDQLVYVAIN